MNYLAITTWVFSGCSSSCVGCDALLSYSLSTTTSSKSKSTKGESKKFGGTWPVSMLFFSSLNPRQICSFLTQLIKCFSMFPFFGLSLYIHQLSFDSCSYSLTVHCTFPYTAHSSQLTAHGSRILHSSLSFPWSFWPALINHVLKHFGSW